MTPQAGKYYRVNGASQYRKVYTANEDEIIFKEIFMSLNRTRIEVRNILNDAWLISDELTKAQFDRIESLAVARMVSASIPITNSQI